MGASQRKSSLIKVQQGEVHHSPGLGDTEPHTWYLDLARDRWELSKVPIWEKLGPKYKETRLISELTSRVRKVAGF